MRHENFSFPVLHHTVDVYIGSADKFLEKEPGLSDVPLKGCYGKTIELKDENRIVIWCRMKTPGIIAHESIHAINIIFSKLAIYTDCNNDEILCYYVQDLVSKIHYEI